MAQEKQEPTTSKPQAAGEPEMTTIDLRNDVQHNTVKYKAGRDVKVPTASAEDIKRIDYEHDQYKETLHKRSVYEVNGGTMQVGQ